jgi:hypothetical protein
MINSSKWVKLGNIIDLYIVKCYCITLVYIKVDDTFNKYSDLRNYIHNKTINYNSLLY